MNWKELKEAHQKEFNKFSDKAIIFAFNKEQLQEGLDKHGVEEGDLIPLGAGGFVIYDYYWQFNELLAKHNQEKRDFIDSDNENLKNAILSEMWNYEYYFRMDCRDILSALTFSVDEFNEKDVEYRKNFHTVYNEAERQYIEEFEKINC